MDKADIKARSEELLQKFGLYERRKDHVGSCFGGMAQRLRIARAMLHRPEILFLDEPTTGLDPNYRQILWDQMLAMNKEGRRSSSPPTTWRRSRTSASMWRS